MDVIQQLLNKEIVEMRHKLFILFSIIIILIACSSDSSIREEAMIEATPLPTYQSSQLSHTDFFTETSDYPKVDEVTDFCKMLINNHENDWNALTDAFELEFDKDKYTYFTFEYEEYLNHGESYLFKEGLQDGHLQREPIMDNTTLGKTFYSYLLNNGEIPFRAVYSFSGRASLIGYVADAYVPDISKCVPIWLVRGRRDNALAIDSVFLTDSICWKVTIIPINDDWFIYYQIDCD